MAAEHSLATQKPTDSEPTTPRRVYSSLALALGVAALSDVIGYWAELAPPVQWIFDLATALVLYRIVGRGRAILPALIAEAIPGLGVFPVWTLVVLSIAGYDVRKRRKPDAGAAK
jgi:hypothetical protein